MEGMKGSNRTEIESCFRNAKNSEDILKSGWEQGVSKEPGMKKQGLKNGVRYL